MTVKRNGSFISRPIPILFYILRFIKIRLNKYKSKVGVHSYTYFKVIKLNESMESVVHEIEFPNSIRLEIYLKTIQTRFRLFRGITLASTYVTSGWFLKKSFTVKTDIFHSEPFFGGSDLYPDYSREWF